MLQDLALGPDTVDVSMETLGSVWARDPCDLGEKLHVPSSVWESQCVFTPSPAAGLMWTEPLSPHLHRNRQLQDKLLQREEELLRLQEENNKLRRFLSSSFVKNLREKAKKLTADGRRTLKRNLMCVTGGPFQNGGPQPLSKRVCRNLTAELCSESPSETSPSSEQNLDLWVLRTLGLKDRDTIDTSNESTSSLGHSLSFLYDSAVSSSSSSSPSSSSSSRYTLSSFSPLAAASSPSAHSSCQSSTHHSDHRFTAAKCHEANSDNPAESAQNLTCSPAQNLTCSPAQNLTCSPAQCADVTAGPLTRQYEAPEAVVRGFNTVTAFQMSTISPDREELCSITASGPDRDPAPHPVYWSSPEGVQTSSQDATHFSPPGERITFSPVSSSTPVSHRLWVPAPGCSPTRPSAGSPTPAPPHTPPRRTDLAFSMSLSRSSTVKTQSFPQGQAFITKDTAGRWNFTWLPTQRP